MSKVNLDDVCGRYLSARLSKQTEFSSSKNRLNNEHIASEHKRHTILTQKLLFKPYKKNPLDQLRQRYTNILMSVNDDVQLKPPLITQTISNTANHSSSLMMNWELLKDRGSGLINLGNTCFINASLQCLANTPPLVQWLLSNSHHQYCRLKLEKQFCLFCEAERIVKLIHSKKSFSSSISPANPNNIVRRIKDISKTFKYGRQEDASEFLICLIDKIVDACLRSSQPPERLRPSSGTSYEQLCHSQTILHDLFALVLRSRVVCSRCRHTSDTFEVQYTWIVGVRNHSDLRQSLQQFVCRETLSGENLYRCMKCKQLVPAIKRYTLHKASKVLLINLKRFEFGKNSHKLSHLVRYPEHLNVSPYISEDNCNDQLLNYRLYAVLVHLGSSMHSGHYFSYVRSPNNRWYKADDTAMIQCDLNQVLTQHGAYILCYIQETTSSNNMINGGTTTMNKVIYQNGKSNNGEKQSVTTNSKFFTPRQIPVQNIPRQINGLNGNMKSIPSTLTKPTVTSSNGESTNGNGTLSSEKREPIVMRIPKLPFISNTPTQLQTTSPSELIHSSTKNSNYSTPSLSSVQSTSSPLKLIIKTSVPLNGLASISNSYKHNGEDSPELQQPLKKKQRIEEPPSPVPSSQSDPTDEQSVPSPSLPTIHKKKKKFHKHKRSRSRSPIPSLTTDEQYRRYRKNKKHRHHQQLSSPSPLEPL